MFDRTTTRTIAGFELALVPGVHYRASRPFATRWSTAYTVTIAPMSYGDAPDVEVPGLSYDRANALINAFNNGATSFDGRVWS